MSVAAIWHLKVHSLGWSRVTQTNPTTLAVLPHTNRSDNLQPLHQTRKLQVFLDFLYYLLSRSKEFNKINKSSPTRYLLSLHQPWWRYQDCFLCNYKEEKRPHFLAAHSQFRIIIIKKKYKKLKIIKKTSKVWVFFYFYFLEFE